jgi:putative membrane protein
MDLAQTIPIADTWGMHGVGVGWMALMMFGMVLLWAAVIFGVSWLLRGAARGESTRGETLGKESPVDILERRFAEGAITEEDYRARREVLVNGTVEPVGGPKTTH